MEAPSIEATTREKVGTRYARRLRSSGRLPGVIYGHQKEPVAISFNERDMVTHLHHGQRLFTVEVEGHAETCLVKDLQFDHLGSDVIHVDLSRVDLTEEVDVSVSVHLVGEPSALKIPGAILRTVADSVDLRCRVMNIPSELTVDISNLEAGGYVSAGDIDMPEGTTLLSDPETMLARIAVVAEVEEEAPAEEEGAEPELVGESDGEAAAEGGEAEETPAE